MVRILLLGILTLLAQSAIGPQHALATECTPNQTLLNRIILIDRQGRGAASGVLFDGQQVLTAYHAVENLSRIWLRLPGRHNEPPVEAVLSNYNPDADLALLRLLTPNQGVSPLTITQQLDPNGKIRFAGCAFGHAYRCGVIPGHFISTARPSNAQTIANLFQLDDFAYGGDSGGGIYTCAGHLVGIEFGNLAKSGEKHKIVGVRAAVIQDLLN